MSLFSRLGDFIDDRTGHRKLVSHLLDEEIKGGARWAYVLGSALLGAFAVQAVTGVALMTSYAPSDKTAWASVHFITFVQAGGWLVRGLHHHGAQAMVMLLVGHLLQVALFGAYKKPREVTWWLGLALFGLTLGFALTGYLLPWDQKAYWATTVTLRIAESVPLLGPFLAAILGGPAVGAMTLNRFYAIHVLFLPAATLMLVLAHVALVQRHGTAGPASNTGDVKRIGDTFHPRQSGRDAIAMTVIFAALMITAILKGAPLDPLANPADTSYVPRPEWYFLGLFQMLKYFPGKLEVIGTLVLPGLGALFLFFLPFLDRSPERAAGKRRPILAAGGALLGAVLVLTALGARDRGGSPEPSWKKEGRDPFYALAGPLVFEKHDCASCHHPDDTGVGPSLLSGSRTRTAAWITDHISDPEFVAPGARDPERRVSGSETGVLLAWLDHREAESSPGAPTGPGENVIALIVNEGCVGCHRIDGAGGRMGPELNGVGDRVSQQWIVDYLPDPEAVNPEARMRSYPDLSLPDREEIAAYLVTLH